MAPLPLVARFALEPAEAAPMLLLDVRRAPDTGELVLSARTVDGNPAPLPAPSRALMPPLFSADEAEAVDLVDAWLARCDWTVLAVERPRQRSSRLAGDQPPQQPPAAPLDGRAAVPAGAGADWLARLSSGTPAASVAVMTLHQIIDRAGRLAAPSTDEDSYPAETSRSGNGYGAGFRDGHAEAMLQVRAELDAMRREVTGRPEPVRLVRAPPVDQNTGFVHGRLPADWRPNPALWDWASESGIDVPLAVENFRHYWTNGAGAHSSKANWDSAFSLWVRSAMSQP